MEDIKVLFIDDDVVLGQIVTAALREEGFEVHYQSSLVGVKAVVTELNPNVIVLDVEIGSYDGIEIAPELRQIAPDTPLLFVSSHVESHEVIRALETGAVTYLKKPIEIEELTAYIKRYAAPVPNQEIKIASFNLDPSTRIMYNGTQEIKKLSKLEFNLLKLLYDNRNKVVPREEIEKLWGDSIMNDHSLYNYIVKLRKLFAIDKDITLTTIQDNGYMLNISDSLKPFSSQ